MFVLTYTRTFRYLLFVEALRNNAFHDFVDDDSLEKLSSMPIIISYKPSAAHFSFKLMVISIDTVVTNCCKNG